MPTCHLCWRRYLSSLAVARLPRQTSPALSRAYAAAAARQPQPLLDRLALADPAKLAHTVRRRLARGDTDAALSLARRGSRSLNSVVSWNHVLQHHIERGEIKRTFGVFNEMKKRGIQPDSHTFTLILNGLAGYTHFNQSLFRALQLYNSLASPKSPVPANVFHTNAILKVCARAGDLDSMWAIVGKLPLKGPNAPNTLTYTTLLNGICYDRTGTDMASAVEDGRRVWAGVLSRWTKGQLWIDEELACAMGRVLLRGEREEDWKEIFTLVEQVFGIKALVAPPAPPKQVTQDTIFAQGTTVPAEIKALAAPPEIKVSDVQKLFTPPVLAKNPSLRITSSTRPLAGNATLSLLLRACAALKDHPTAFKYWTALTSPPINVTPDLENYHDLLRILRRFRSGPEALSIVESMAVRPSAKTFYIALSTCKRGGRSNTFATAEKLIEIMKDRHRIPVDVKIWNMFLQVALKARDPAQIKKALRRVDEEFPMERELKERRSSPVYLERALELLRALIGAVDVLLMDGEAVGVSWGHGERKGFEKRRKEMQVLLAKNGGWPAKRNYNADMEEDYE